MEGSGCTPQEHREYFDRVREKANELANLVAAAPCNYSLAGAVLVVQMLEDECSRLIAMERIAAEHAEKEAEKVKRAFGLS